MRRYFAALAAAVLLIGFTPATHAQDADPLKDTLATILSGEPVPAEMFDQAFLAQVPIDQVNAILQQTLAAIGAPESIIAISGGYLVRTATHEMRVQIATDAEGEVSTLLLHGAIETGKDVATLVKDFETLPGKVAYLVLKDGDVLHARNESEPLAVGSGFKLGILSVLNEDVAAGKHRWDEVIELEARQVSLPTGIVQSFPVGAPLTLHTLASLMISISDNTATDMLLDLVGRERVAKKLGIDFVIKTRELFMLKSDKEMRERFLAADTAGRAAMIAEMDAAPLTATGANDPLTEGVEWYVPLTTLCSLMAEVAPLDVMQISPGPAYPEDWQSVAFKGGSEIGVLNLTTQVTDENGSTYCVAFTWNDAKALDEARGAATYASILSSLSRQ
jgi:beta-lactamase class A